MDSVSSTQVLVLHTGKCQWLFIDSKTTNSKSDMKKDLLTEKLNLINVKEDPHWSIIMANLVNKRTYIL